MWRESLLPLGCEAAPKPDSPFPSDIPHAPDYDDCVAERINAVLKYLGSCLHLPA